MLGLLLRGCCGAAAAGVDAPCQAMQDAAPHSNSASHPTAMSTTVSATGSRVTVSETDRSACTQYGEIATAANELTAGSLPLAPANRTLQEPVATTSHQQQEPAAAAQPAAPADYNAATSKAPVGCAATGPAEPDIRAGAQEWKAAVWGCGPALAIAGDELPSPMKHTPYTTRLPTAWQAAGSQVHQPANATLIESCMAQHDFVGAHELKGHAYNPSISVQIPESDSAEPHSLHLATTYTPSSSSFQKLSTYRTSVSSSNTLTSASRLSPYPGCLSIGSSSVCPRTSASTGAAGHSRFSSYSGRATAGLSSSVLHAVAYISQARRSLDKQEEHPAGGQAGRMSTGNLSRLSNNLSRKSTRSVSGLQSGPLSSSLIGNTDPLSAAAAAVSQAHILSVSSRRGSVGNASTGQQPADASDCASLEHLVHHSSNGSGAAPRPRITHSSLVRDATHMPDAASGGAAGVAGLAQFTDSAQAGVPPAAVAIARQCARSTPAAGLSMMPPSPCTPPAQATTTNATAAPSSSQQHSTAAAACNASHDARMHPAAAMHGFSPTGTSVAGAGTGLLSRPVVPAAAGTDADGPVYMQLSHELPMVGAPLPLNKPATAVEALRGAPGDDASHWNVQLSCSDDGVGLCTGTAPRQVVGTAAASGASSSMQGGMQASSVSGFPAPALDSVCEESGEQVIGAGWPAADMCPTATDPVAVPGSLYVPEQRGSNDSQHPGHCPRLSSPAAAHRSCRSHSQLVDSPLMLSPAGSCEAQGRQASGSPAMTPSGRGASHSAVRRQASSASLRGQPKGSMSGMDGLVRMAMLLGPRLQSGSGSGGGSGRHGCGGARELATHSTGIITTHGACRGGTNGGSGSANGAAARGVLCGSSVHGRGSYSGGSAVAHYGSGLGGKSGLGSPAQAALFRGIFDGECVRHHSYNGGL